MLSAGRRIGVQADAEGRRGAVARRTGADKPGFPALGRAVFHPPEEAVGCKVAIEAAADFGGIAAETGKEIEAFLQLGVGSDRAGKLAHFVEVLLVLDDQHLVVSFQGGIAAAEAARGAADVCAKSSAESLSRLRCELLVDPHSDGLARRLIETSSDRQSRNQPLHVFKPSGVYQDLTRTRTRHVRVLPRSIYPLERLVWFSVARPRDARAPTAYRS
jgi:hypothetical protein